MDKLKAIALLKLGKGKMLMISTIKRIPLTSNPIERDKYYPLNQLVELIEKYQKQGYFIGNESDEQTFERIQLYLKDKDLKQSEKSFMVRNALFHHFRFKLDEQNKPKPIEDTQEVKYLREELKTLNTELFHMPNTHRNFKSKSRRVEILRDKIEKLREKYN